MQATAVLHSGRIAFYNDVFRRRGTGMILTSGVRELKDLRRLLEAVRSFKAFTPSNDPHGEHDFGSIQWGAEKVFWKIDYYDQSLEYWEDPTSPRCRRVITVMLASEY
jgi:hypothetical protein